MVALDGSLWHKTAGASSTSDPLNSPRHGVDNPVLQISGLLEDQQKCDVGVGDIIEMEDNLTEENVHELKEEFQDQMNVVENLNFSSNSVETEDLKIKKPLISTEEEKEEEEEEEEDLLWDDVKTVSFEFIKFGNSKGDGVLITHDRNYKVR